MEIKYLGGKTIFLKGKKESILVDPGESFFENSKFAARAVLYTSEDERSADLVGDRILMNGAGEYEIGGLEIIGVNGEDGNTLYKMVIDDFKVVVIGKLEQELSDKKIERVDEADILIVSLSENMDYKMFKDLAKKWGVNYLIPISENKEVLNKFLDDADTEGLEAVESLKLEKLDDLPDGLEVKLLKVAV